MRMVHTRLPVWKASRTTSWAALCQETGCAPALVGPVWQGAPKQTRGDLLPPYSPVPLPEPTSAPAVLETDLEAAEADWMYYRRYYGRYRPVYRRRYPRFFYRRSG